MYQWLTLKALQLITAHSGLFSESHTVLQGVLRPAVNVAATRPASDSGALCNDTDMNVS